MKRKFLLTFFWQQNTPKVHEEIISQRRGDAEGFCIQSLQGAPRRGNLLNFIVFLKDCEIIYSRPTISLCYLKIQIPIVLYIICIPTKI
jgi:hypothetical protein